jgi:peptidoglycan/LPS O-acetylase OafA/YrhL
MDRIYFKNLNGLRFIAASMVLISHIEQIKDLRGSKSIYKNGYIFLYEKAPNIRNINNASF